MASFFPPQDGGGSDFEPFTGYAVQYVSRTGSNSDDGTIERPKKTCSAAYQQLTDGGVIKVTADPDAGTGPDWSDGTEGLGLVDGQGCFVGDGYLANCEGWLETKSFTVEAYGTNSGTQFGSQVVYLPWGQRGYTAPFRKNPAVWIANTTQPITFRNVQLLANQPARLGWDYIRNDDYTINAPDVTVAVRAAGETTLTVGSKTYTVSRLTRTSNVTTIRFSSLTPNQWRPGSKIILDPGSSSANFPAGTYVVDALPVAFSATEVDVTVADVAANAPLETPTGASITGHGAIEGDWLDLDSDNAEFPASMYEVIDNPTGTTLVIRDKYGFAPRSASASEVDIGTYSLHLRYLGVSFDRFDNCNLAVMFGGGLKFGQGPCIDRGGGAGGDWSWVVNCTLGGAFPETGSSWDEVEIARTASHFIGGYFGSGVQQTNCIMIGGNIFMPIMGGLGGPAFALFDNIVQEGNFGDLNIRPCVEFGTGTAGTVQVNRCWNTDDSNEFLIGCDLGTIEGTVETTGTVTKGGPLRDYLQQPVILSAPAPGFSLWDGVTESYEARRVSGTYASDSRLAGKIPDAVAQFGFYQGGYWPKNVLPQDLTDTVVWTQGSPSGLTRTGGQLAPDGTLGAYLLQGTGYITLAAADVLEPIGPSAAGDVFAMSWWAKMVDGDTLPIRLSRLGGGSQGLMWDFLSPFGGDGEWQFITVRSQTLTGAASDWVLELYNEGNDMLVYQPTLYWLPASSYSANEQARLAKTMRAYPEYLQQGSVGTMEGTPVIAHGGIGTAPLTVGVGSGQITLGAALTTVVQIVDLDGNVIGVVVPNAFTVNP